ncbi:hypothetical protein TRVL_09957 [Trypanosoma vivax]|nr:hypothetical protein TRVL_09957 [Trypanosoma vivax]
MLSLTPMAKSLPEAHCSLQANKNIRFSLEMLSADFHVPFRLLRDFRRGFSCVFFILGHVPSHPSICKKEHTHLHTTGCTMLQQSRYFANRSNRLSSIRVSTLRFYIHKRTHIPTKTPQCFKHLFFSDTQAKLTHPRAQCSPHPFILSTRRTFLFELPSQPQKAQHTYPNAVLMTKASPPNRLSHRHSFATYFQSTALFLPAASALRSPDPHKRIS